MSTHSRNRVYHYARTLQAWLLPYTCILCRKEAETGIDLCQACLNSLPWLDACCFRCALPLPPGAAGKNLCGACLNRPPAFYRAVSAFHYADPVAGLVTAFKYRQKLLYGEVLAALLLRRLEFCYRDSPCPDLLVPVPLHPRRLRQRGFNQALELARPIATRLGIPLHHSCCRRLRQTPPQLGLSAPQRRRNLRNAFALQAGSMQDVGRVALIDDVMTTGSTLQELSRLLISHGVREVHVWSVARTI
ncbi:MAG: ComF family protein [Pseudomonadales bacterium]|nr:ComF family protein [Pseudomonadales bacterium]